MLVMACLSDMWILTNLWQSYYPHAETLSLTTYFSLQEAGPAPPCNLPSVRRPELPITAHHVEEASRSPSPSKPRHNMSEWNTRVKIVFLRCRAWNHRNCIIFDQGKAIIYGFSAGVFTRSRQSELVSHTITSKGKVSSILHGSGLALVENGAMVQARSAH